GRNKDVALQLALGPRREGAGFGDDEAVAIAMHAQPADDQVLVGSGSGQSPAFFTDGDELAPAGQFTKKLLQAAAVAALEPQVMDQLFEAGHVLGLSGNVMQDLL